VAEEYNYAIRKITAEGVVTTLAGSPGISGTADGTGRAARFNTPTGVTVDGSGNVYVAEWYNNTVRKITPQGVVTTVAGSPEVTGTANGTGSAARFWYPYGVAVDGNGNLYVSEYVSSTIRKITGQGVVSTLAGTPGVTGTADGTGSAARFDHPVGVAADANGTVYVADQFNQTIRKISPAGVVSTIAGVPKVHGSADTGGGTGDPRRSPAQGPSRSDDSGGEG